MRLALRDRPSTLHRLALSEWRRRGILALLSNVVERYPYGRRRKCANLRTNGGRRPSWHHEDQRDVDMLSSPLIGVTALSCREDATPANISFVTKVGDP